MLNTIYIGIGQCGNRFADCFAKASTEDKAVRNGGAGITSIAINTTEGDMSMLKNINEENKIMIRLNGRPEGAGRDPKIGQESMEANLPIIDECFKTVCKKAKMDNIDLCFLWAGLGGGTGTGGLLVLAKYLVKKGYNIAIGVTMPNKEEGMVARGNAYNALAEIQEWLSCKENRTIPYIVIDNNNIKNVRLERSNEMIADSIIKLNKATSYELAGSNFDNADFLKVLKRFGTMSFIKTTVPYSQMGVGDKEVLLNAVKEEYENVPFTKSDITLAEAAAVVIVASRKTLEAAKGAVRTAIDENIAKLKEFLSSKNIYDAVFVHPSEDIGDKIFAYVLLTGLAAPQKEMEQLEKEVVELIRESKEIRKANLKSVKGFKKLSLDLDDDDDDDDDTDNEGSLPQNTHQHYSFAK